MEDSSVKYSRHNVIAGGIFIGIAALFIVQSSSYDFGTALQMGPGFFPIVLAVTLSIFGMLILIDGLRKPPEPVDGAVPGAVSSSCAALAVFGAGARSLGLIPVVFLCTFMAAQASRKNAPLSAPGQRVRHVRPVLRDLQDRSCRIAADLRSGSRLLRWLL